MDYVVVVLAAVQQPERRQTWAPEPLVRTQQHLAWEPQKVPLVVAAVAVVVRSRAAGVEPEPFLPPVLVSWRLPTPLVACVDGAGVVRSWSWPVLLGDELVRGCMDGLQTRHHWGRHQQLLGIVVVVVVPLEVVVAVVVEQDVVVVVVAADEIKVDVAVPAGRGVAGGFLGVGFQQSLQFSLV